MTRVSQHGQGRGALTPEVIVADAMALANAEGLAAVTIRKLAGRLGVTPMALYWHVRDKDALLDALAASLLKEVDLSLETGAGWQYDLRALLQSLLEVARANPALAPLMATRTIASEGGLRATEVLLDILARGGFTPVEATQIARHAVSAIANLVSGEAGVIAGNEPDHMPDARQQARHALESLPSDTYPRLVAAAQPLTEGINPDTWFAFGLDLLLAGIEAMAAPRTAPSAENETGWLD